MPSTLDDLPSDYAGARILNSKQSAEFCGFNEEYWRQLHRTGKTPPAVKLGGRKLGWRISSLVEWQETRLAA